MEARVRPAAGERLLECSGGCPYKLFVSYYDWYGVADYGNQFVLGALGTPANGQDDAPDARARTLLCCPRYS